MLTLYYFSLKNCSIVYNVEEAESLDSSDVIAVFVNVVWMNFKLSGFDIDVVHISLF